MKPIFRPFGCILCLAVVISFAACDAGESDNVLTLSNGTLEINNVLPEKDTLIDNLEKAGYSIARHTSIEGSNLTLDRVFAEKGNKYIDITFCPSEKEAAQLFDSYCDIYKADNNYYILAQNLNLVYCVTDKKTFSNAGFTSTSNIGTQYIN